MKKFFTTTMLFLIPVLIFAGGAHPPRPVRVPGPPPGLPIDQYIYVLFAIGILMIISLPKLKKLKK